jgi:hypothetical protein
MPKRYYHQGLDFGAHRAAKQEICRILRRSLDNHRYTQMQAAIRLETSQANISRAIRYPTVEQLSYNHLFRILGLLEPQFRILISL